MLSSLMEWLGEGLSASYPAALAASFAWGLCSMILSPCHLVSIPLLVGYIERDAQENSIKTKRFPLALIFASGMSISIALIGFVTGLMGRIIGDIGAIGNVVMAMLLVYVGLTITGLLELPFASRGKERRPAGKGYPGAFLVGLILGATLGPCTFAFMAPVLALMFSVGSDNLAQAVYLGLMFTAGHGLLVVLAGTYGNRISRVISWSGDSSASRLFRIICGTLVALGGLYLLLKTL